MKDTFWFSCGTTIKENNIKLYIYEVYYTLYIVIYIYIIIYIFETYLLCLTNIFQGFSIV